MVLDLIEVVSELFKSTFGIQIRPEWVIELDSSTPRKFSRHLVFRLRRAAFPSNLHVNAFVSRVVKEVLERG